MIELTYFKPDKLERFRLKDKYLITQDCIILGNWQPDLPVEVQGYLKVHGHLQVQGGYLTVSGYISAELGVVAKGDIVSGAYINAGDNIVSEEGDITAQNDIRTTGSIIAGGGDITTGGNFGIFAGGRIEAKEIHNGGNVFAGVTTWDSDPDKTENIKAEKIHKPTKVRIGKVEIVKPPKEPKEVKPK